MKILELTAENVKRLKAVHIVPGENMQIVTGRNAQGKSSVLDSIWLALGGGQASRGTAKPVRDGEDRAKVTLDLGDLTVTRTWVGDKTALTVTTVDGAKHSSPQAVLDALVGRLSFDPLAFTMLTPREQLEALTSVVEMDVNLEALAYRRKSAYDQRTEIGRNLKALGDVPAPRADVPDVEVSARDIIARITDAQRVTAENGRDIELARVIRQDIDLAEQELLRLRDELDATNARIAAHVMPDDIDALNLELDKVEETNARVRENDARRVKAAAAAQMQAEMDAHTATIAECDKERADALAAAQFPVDGLGFDEDGVTYRGVPFSQASSAEQIRVSLAMAMSLNPELRVIRIMDGSLLDDENLALIASMAQEHDFQVWVERVSDSSPSAVVIEDGEVADPWA